ncbi:hypothetical protein CERSUDRAFT_116160 [Gelatoporia subvermispora B]|uniref:Uncharacterized protein n=1 Tax=Ceriporiopsis subvermispora (strain B) TaxID=914234 RepID=M2QEA6_CERS8|nr:hypothetical protein CERSUDRAFT_116160 [Gelatoporia subvermispora B]
MDIHSQAVVYGNVRLLSRLGGSNKLSRRRKFNKISTMVDWFALYFARNQHGDAAGVSVQCEPGLITLHVAVTGIPTAEDRASGEQLLSQLRTLFSEKLTDTTQVQLLRRLILRKSTPRVRRRLERFLDITTYWPSSISDLGIYDSFEQALSTWESLGRRENSMGCLELSQEFYGDEHHGVAALSKAFSSLLATTQEVTQLMASETGDDRWLTVLNKVWRLLAIILTSDVFRDVGKIAMGLFPEQWLFIYSLYLKLWSLYSYSYGAYQFVKDGMPAFRQTLGEDGVSDFLRGDGGIVVAWVKDAAPYLPLSCEPLPLPITPATHLNSFIESCALRDRYRPGIRALLQSNVRVTGAWNAGDLVVPKLHPEMQLIAYFTKEGISVLGSCIGVSKPVCWACEKCINSSRPLLKDFRFTTKWKVSEVSRKVKDDWVPPPNEAGDRTVKFLARELGQRIALRLDPLLYEVDSIRVREYSDDQFDKCPELQYAPDAWGRYVDSVLSF